MCAHYHSYYSDVNLSYYKGIFSSAFNHYQGKSFSQVLDIGCGVGSLGEALKPLNIDYYGLEGSDKGIATAKEKGLNCQKFLLETNHPLPFKDNSFSFVSMNQVIEHIDKEVGQYYIKEIIRVLEPGGVAIINSPSRYSKIWRTDPHHIYCWRPKELLKEVQKHQEVKLAKLERAPLEPWMFFNYNEKVIDTWHKYNKYPKTKKIFSLTGRVIDKTLNKTIKSDRFLAVADVVFVKCRD